MADADSNLWAAERVASLPVANRVVAVVIAGVALAAHRYVRHTEDIDLGVDADIPKMRVLAAVMRTEGFVVEFYEPDGDDRCSVH